MEVLAIAGFSLSEPAAIAAALFAPRQREPLPRRRGDRAGAQVRMHVEHVS